jgi:hypothetical protein
VTEHALQINKIYQRSALWVGAYCATSLLLLLIAPILSFIFTGLVLINSKAIVTRMPRLYLAMVMILSLAMMAGARPLEAGDSNDIVGYYDTYRMLVGGDLSYLTHFGGGLEDGIGVEVGLPLLLYFFGLFLPLLSVNGLMFCLAFASSLLLLIWFERTFYADNRMHYTALIGVCILMLNLYFSTQLTRQFFSLSILLYAFTAHGRVRQFAYVILAGMFHLTAIPYFIMFTMARRGRIGLVFIFALLVVLHYIFPQIVAIKDVLPQAISEKLLWYTLNEETYSAADIASLRMILLLCSISLLVWVVVRFKPAVEARSWLALPWLVAIAHLLLLSIPLASLRTTLLVHSIIPGLLAYKMFEGGGSTVRNLRMLVLNVLLVYKIFVYLTAEQSGNLFSTMHMLTDFVV